MGCDTCCVTWCRCVWYNATHLTSKKVEQRHQFLQHLNSIDPHIQVTAEDPNTYGSLPFLDTLVTPGPGNTLLTKVYRKPTHTGQYLHLENHHNHSTKYGLFNTLTHRARTVHANPWLLQKEEEHIKGTLQRCRCPNWVLTRLKIKTTMSIMPHKSTTTTVTMSITTTITSIWWYPTQTV